MKKIGCAVLCLCLLGLLIACKTPEVLPETVTAAASGEYTKIQPVGQVPEGFQAVVEENLLGDICVSGDAFFRVTVADGCYRIDKYNMDFQVTASCRYTPPEVLLSSASDAFLHSVYRIGSRLLATSDGGFLFTVAPTDQMTRMNGTANSYVVKCGPDGTVQWQYNGGDVGSQGLEFPLEWEGCYYLVGTVESRPGESYTDASIVQLDGNGQLVRQETYGGSGFDWLNFCQIHDGGLQMWLCTQSKDGDCSASRDGNGVNVAAQIGKDLELLSFHLTESPPPEPKGELHGETVYAGVGILRDFAWGQPSAVLDCGEQYLVISENITGVYPNQPLFISALWYLTETVYSAYDETGALLWRAAVDSSPDYDSLVLQYPESLLPSSVKEN